MIVEPADDALLLQDSRRVQGHCAIRVLIRPGGVAPAVKRLVLAALEIVEARDRVLEPLRRVPRFQLVRIAEGHQSGLRHEGHESATQVRHGRGRGDGAELLDHQLAPVGPTRELREEHLDRPLSRRPFESKVPADAPRKVSLRVRGTDLHPPAQLQRERGKPRERVVHRHGRLPRGDDVDIPAVELDAGVVDVHGHGRGLAALPPREGEGPARRAVAARAERRTRDEQVGPVRIRHREQ